MNASVKLFGDLVSRIEDEYDRLGAEMGWRFLYSPKRTLHPKTKIVFIGLNPGGRAFELEIPSVEKGNAYRVEDWPPRHPNPLQNQVRKLYDEVAAAAGLGASEELMDESLSANFYPFRSPNIQELHRKPECLAFARALWLDILKHTNPNLIITMGKEVTSEIKTLISELGTVGNGRLLDTGWRNGPNGSVRYDLTWMTLKGRRVLHVGLPHLSRFKIFGRVGTSHLFKPLRAAIRKSMR